MRFFPVVGFFALAVLLSGCTGSAVNPSAPPEQNAFCPSSSDCELVFTGTSFCPACDQGNPDWVCMKKDEAALSGLFSFVSKLTGFFSVSLNQPDCSCPMQEFEYSCSCEQGKCTKVVLGKNDSYCRQSADCYQNDLEHSECFGVWLCEQNSCVWQCSLAQPEEEPAALPVMDNAQPVLPFDCGSDYECFGSYLALCGHAKYHHESVRFFSGVRNAFLIEQEILGPDAQGICMVKQVSVNKSNSSVTASDCLYDGLQQVQCRVVSGG